MNAPIAEDVARDMADSEPTRIHPPHPRPGVTRGSDYMSDLLDGQQVYIAAQHRFLHDEDMTALLRAQREMIKCQTEVLNRLGVFG